MQEFEDRIQQVTRFFNRAETLLAMFGRFDPGTSEDYGDSTIIEISDVVKERFQDPNAEVYLILLHDETDEVRSMDLEWKVGQDRFVIKINQDGAVSMGLLNRVTGDVTKVLKQAHEYLHRIELICFERQLAASGRSPNETDEPQPGPTGVSKAESRVMDQEALFHTAGPGLTQFQEEVRQSILNGTFNAHQDAILPTSGAKLAAIVQVLAGTKVIIPVEEGSNTQILQKGDFDYWIHFYRIQEESKAQIFLRVGQRDAPDIGSYDLTTVGLQLRRVGDSSLAKVESDIELLLFTNLEVGAEYVFTER